MNQELGYYGSLCIVLLRVFPPEVVYILVKTLQDTIQTDAIHYHVKRYPWATMNFVDQEYKIFREYDWKHRNITESIRILHEPFFWRMQDPEIGPVYINGFIYRSHRQPWHRPVISNRLHKLDLFNAHEELIRNAWYQKQKTRDSRYDITFMIEDIECDRYSHIDAVEERWFLLATEM